MKSICITVALTLFCFFGFGQNLFVRPLNSSITIFDKETQPIGEFGLGMSSAECRHDSTYFYLNTFGLYRKSVFSYDTEGNVNEQLDQRLINNEWVNEKLHQNEYDGTGNRIEQVVSVWDGLTWMNDSRFVYTYLDTFLVGLLQMDWSNGNWANDERYLFSYGIDGPLTISLEQAWTGFEWVNWKKYTSNYDGLGNEIEYLKEDWDDPNWVKVYRFANHTYDGQNNLIEKVKQHWAQSGSQWVNNSRNNYTYSGQYLVEHIIEEWTGSTWQDDLRFSYEYDQYGNNTGLVEEHWTSSGWNEDDSYTYYYDCTLSVIGNEQINGLNIYPNPSTGMFNLTWSHGNPDYSYEVIDLFGELVVSGQLDSDKTSFDMRDFAAGVYLLKVSSGLGKTNYHKMQLIK